MQNPKVTVLMPAYNAEKYIGTAIESILNQTYKECKNNREKTKIDVEMSEERKICSKRLNLFLKTS